jgi:hypothetical protein
MAIGLFVLIIAKSSFPMFNPSSASERLINTTGNIGPQDSSFMWTNRTLDLMAQAFVIFTAAAGSLAILRIAEKKDNVND